MVSKVIAALLIAQITNGQDTAMKTRQDNNFQMEKT